MNAALAWDVEPGAHALVALGVPESMPTVVGMGGSLAFGPRRGLNLEFTGQYGLTTNRGTYGDLAGGLRLYLWTTDRPVLSLYAQGGVGSTALLGPMLTGGLAVDLEGGSERPRLQVGYAWLDGDLRLTLRAGMVFGRSRRPAVAVVPPPIPLVEEPTPTRLESGMVWLPAPVCEWLPNDEAESRIQSMELQVSTIQVLNQRTLRGVDGSPEPANGADADEPLTPMIVVSALPGDVVTLNGEPLTLDQGFLILPHPEGAAEIRVVGGGREVVHTLGVVQDHAVWVAPESPPVVTVSFPSGRATAEPAELDRVRALAATRGAWSYRVEGAYSNDGNLERNLLLAAERAQAIEALLLDAGVPRENLERAERIPSPDPALSPAEQRRTRILPVEPR